MLHSVEQVYEAWMTKPINDIMHSKMPLTFPLGLHFASFYFYPFFFPWGWGSLHLAKNQPIPPPFPI